MDEKDDFDEEKSNNASQDSTDTKEEVESPRRIDEGSEDSTLSRSILLSDEEDEEDEEESLSRTKGSYFHVPYGFQSMGCYKHASKNCEIGGVTFNNRFRQFVILDSRGVTSWSYESVYSTVTRHLNYPAYQFNVLRMIIFSRKFNVYFALSKEYALKVFNLNFHEVISVSAEMHSVLCMVFNPGRNELITGGTGGMKFWRFGELTKDKRKSFSNDSRPMANYGLVLRASYPKMGGSWVKHVELDVAMQRLYCLSERNVVAYDMVGNELFQVKNAHRGPVTGCVYSKSCNLLVTTGNDCDVNVWSRSGGLVHTFSSHTKVITKIMIHPEASGVVITSSMDGMVKMFSLDVMEEIYSLPVFHEGINWMDYVSPKTLYCCSNRQIEVFALNHVLDFWALSRCCVRSMSLVTCAGKSSRVMVVGSDSSVRLFSRTGKTLSTVLPPPPISPLTQVIDVTYSREYNIMYLLIDSQEIWVYYTRTNPATRLEAWHLDYVEDIHSTHSIDHQSNKSRSSTPWTTNDGHKSPSSKPGSPRLTTPWDGGSSLFLDSTPNPQHERVSLTCLGMLYSNIVIDSVEGQACPDATNFLLTGTEDGRVLFLHMFCKGMKYSQLKVHKGMILHVEHDQDNHTLVTQCRALNGIDVQFWSLPDLTLIQQISCQSDVTCHVRMEDLFLTGHESGFIYPHRLDPATEEDVFTTQEGKRPQPRDHQGPVNSIDAHRSLGIFCSSSTDGFLRLWDKAKTLLREIFLDSSLTAARFLNDRGDVLIGFKQHIFLISHTRVLPSKELQSRIVDDGEDDTFETESDIYEDPSVRYEGKKILQPDPTNMENYLVPFPNLQLKASFFMDGRPPPDLQQQDLQENLESISSMSDSLSLAPTDIYFSPNSTPRSMSLSSGPVVGRKDSMADEIKLPETDIWKLPDFGDSPVSSPPRTPPPEPTPPPTPPPEELTDEEEQESKDKGEQEAAINDTPSCEECKTPVKLKEKKTINFPIFKREGGRLSNARIDSKSLRSSSGPGYAAPVTRQNVPSIPEPKQYKPRRPPRITKKTKKPKDKPEENQADNSTGTKDPNEPADSENNQAVNEAGIKEHLQGCESELVHNDAINDPHSDKKIQQEELKSVQDSDMSHQQSRASSQNVFGSAQEVQRHEKGAWKNKEHEKEMGASESQRLQEPVQDSASQQIKDKAEGNNDTIPDNEAYEAGKENTHLEDGSGQNNENKIREDSKPPEDEHIELHPDLHDRFGDLDEDALQVVYVDPETGETLEGLLGEVPEGAKIIEIKKGPYDDTGSIASGRQSKQKKRQKSVTFNNQQNENGNRSKSFSKQKGQDLESNTPRTQKGWASRDRTYVVPSGDTNHDLHEDLVIKGLRGDNSVSPLAIFALARSRKENAAKQARRARSARSPSSYAMYSPDKNDIGRQDYDSQTKPFNLDVVLPTEDVPRPSSRLSGTTRPKSSKKPEDDVVKWCINALRKSRAHLSIPDKPSRPGSSQSAGGAPDRKEDATWVKKVGIKQGHTLFINLPDKSPRPNSSATFQSTDSKEEYTMYPYKGLFGTDDDKTHSVHQMRYTRAKTAPPGRGRRTDFEQTRQEAKGDVQDGLEFTRDTDGYYTDFYRFQSSDDRPASSLDFPSLDVDDYSGNWQEIVLARARLLKQQRLERQKSAKERRQTHQNQLKERWQKTNHFDCTKAETDNLERSVEFLTSSELTLNQIKPTLPDNTIKQLKEQELSSEQPFRLRIQPRLGSASLTRPARSIMTVMASDHNVEDIARVMPRPKTAASIPNKCSRFVLVAGDPNPTAPKPTKMEKTLIMTRFPNDRVLKKNRAIRHRPTVRKSVET